MNVHAGNKNVFETARGIPFSTSDVENGDEQFQQEIAAVQNDDSIDLDDALDEDNDNPVSHTLVEAAENSGTEEFRDTRELEGEEQESKDRTGSLSPLYNEI